MSIPRPEIVQVLDRTVTFLRRYVVFANREQADAVALWCGHTWLYDQFDTTPYLAVQSPEKRSGKSRLLECLTLLVREPLSAGGTSVAAVFRIVNEKHPSLLLDEADTVFRSRMADNGAEELRGLLNNGYRRGTPYLRVVGEGKKMRVERFDVYSPKAIASIGRLPDTVQDRSIVITLKRRTRHEPLERFRFRSAEQEAIPIRERWKAIAGEIKLTEEADVPDQLDDRAADSWEPLMALADAAGGEWPHRARHAALVLAGATEVEEEKVAILLLADIRDLFAERDGDRISIKMIHDELLSDRFVEHPWQEWNNGRGLKPTGIGRLLGPFGIRARQLRFNSVNVRGYERDQFVDAWNRYLPSDSETNRYTATSKRESEDDRSGVAVHPLSSRGKTGGGDHEAVMPIPLFAGAPPETVELVDQTELP
jgi:hypothetical protein